MTAESAVSKFDPLILWRFFGADRTHFTEDALPIKSTGYELLQYQFGTFDIECRSRPITLFSGRRTALRTYAFDGKAGVLNWRVAVASGLPKGPGFERLQLGRTDLDAFRPAGLGATRGVPRKAVECTGANPARPIACLRNQTYGPRRACLSAMVHHALQARRGHRSECALLIRTSTSRAAELKSAVSDLGALDRKICQMDSIERNPHLSLVPDALLSYRPSSKGDWYSDDS